MMVVAQVYHVDLADPHSHVGANLFPPPSLYKIKLASQHLSSPGVFLLMYTVVTDEPFRRLGFVKAEPQIKLTPQQTDVSNC